MAEVFLIGGGRDDEAVVASHAPFVHAVGERPIVALALEDPSHWEDALRLAGARDVRAIVVSEERPPVRDDFEGAGGVYVAGGWTPGYHEALYGVPDWLPRDLPYAGFSAGAALASEHAILGGWRLGALEVCAEEVGEDLVELTVRPGLGLVPFAVDVHATQWGTPTRLIHAVRAGLTPTGWAIDEGTVLIVDGDDVRVEGLGAAYFVDGDLRLRVVAG